MLGRDDDGFLLEEKLSELQCGIELPRQWQNFFDVRGPVPTCPEESRSFPRFHYRGRAVLGYRQSLPSLPRDDSLFCIYTKDVSRAGICFLHSEQLFPQEVVRVWLPGGISVDVSVVRVTQVAARLFEIGARFLLPNEHASWWDQLRQNDGDQSREGST